NYNNHPFAGHADKEFAFAHNGVLYNDTTLRRDRKLPDTHIETDSYIGVQLIEQQGTLDFNSLRYMAESVQGNYTFTVLDEDNTLYIVKGLNPMCLIHFEALGLYVYASTESIMKKALQRSMLSRFSFTKVDCVEGEILRIDSNGIVAREEFEPAIYRSRFMSWYGDDEPYYSIHEELLLAYCGCYGVDTADVEMLLEYGYTCDEIEDMLADHSLLQETLQAIKCEDCDSLYK
ncbi:MAG: glucosamine 6-phosphate synthetase, partial [Ruminococcus sp.]|nr:glucosamine 6-phosphate synthetase [Ruminococcus sp.]